MLCRFFVLQRDMADESNDLAGYIAALNWHLLTRMNQIAPNFKERPLPYASETLTFPMRR